MTRVRKEDLLRLVLVGDAQVSSDGARVAYVRRHVDEDKDTYISNVWVWEDGANRQYTAGDKDSSPRWSPDGRWLAFVSGREDESQIFLIPTSGGEASRLTELKLGGGTPVWSPDSSRVAFAAPVSTRADDGDNGSPGLSRRDASQEPRHDSGDDKKTKEKTKVIDRIGYKSDGAGFIHDRRRHLFVADIAARRVTQITDGDFHDGDPAWSPDGKHLAFSSNRHSEWDIEIESQIWQVSSEGGEPRQITREAGSWQKPVYSSDGARLAYVGFPHVEGEPPSGFARLWSIARDGTDAVELLGKSDLDIGNSVNSDWKIPSAGGLTWASNGIWFEGSHRGAGAIYRWNEGLACETEPHHDVSSFSVAPDGSVLAYVQSDPTHPPEVFRRRNGETEQLTSCNRGYLTDVGLQDLEPIEFKGADDETIEGWIMKPAGFQEGVAYPLVLAIHGGPQTAYGWSFFHEMQLLAAEGYGVMMTNPHGSSSYGEGFQRAIERDWGNKDYEDIMAAAEVAASLPWVDARRMAVAGGSYGGYMTSWLIGHDSEGTPPRFAAAVVERAVTNLVSFFGTTDFPPFWTASWATTPEDNAMELWAHSPMAHVARIRTPTLVIHSERDDRAPIEQGEQFFVALRRRRVPARFVRFPEESHGLSREGTPSRRLERLQHITDWLREHV